MRILHPIVLSSTLSLGFALVPLSLMAGSHPSPIGEVPTDRVIVRIRADGATAKRAIPREEMTALAGDALGERLEFHRVMGDGALVMRLSRRLAPSQIEARAKAFELDGTTVEIEPDRIAFPQLVPNDQLFPAWHLSGANGINAPAAWDVTTGSTRVVIAILDTGYLPHDDLIGRRLPGYDFVSDTARANDGGARDADAYDPGDGVQSPGDNSLIASGCPVANSSWHGLQMAGIIVGNANNGIGVAGINWNSSWVPVRVAGKCGGYISDIADGLRWAAGLTAPVDPLNPNGPTVPTNANPAKVINVSLATASPTCGTTLQSAIDAVVNTARATVVVAAGNDQGSPANEFSPANCANVITVGATDVNGGRPAYANTGSVIALSAPGGVGSVPSTAIVTTSNNGTQSPGPTSTYPAVFGTSASAAIVTGVASLVLSVKPDLTPAQVRDILVSNARPFPTGTGSDCTPSLCGAGLLDAAAAVAVVNDPSAGLPDIATGAEHTLGLHANGTVYAWGANAWGQVGDGTTTPRLVPTPVPAFNGATRIAAGRDHTLAVRVDGSVWAWGRNHHGQLGTGLTSTSPQLSPVRVAGLRGVVEIAAGEHHSVARTRDGRVWAWGDNTGSALGNGTTVDSALPAAVPGITNAVALSAGRWHTCAALADGSAWCWGDLRTLGLNPTTSPVQVAVAGLASTLSRRMDGGHLLLLNSSTSTIVRAMGANAYGQLGTTATNSPQSSPVIGVSGGFTYGQVAAGRRHSVALADTGDVVAWGDNISGQLGRGIAPGDATAGGHSPVATVVAGVKYAKRIAAAGDRSFALRADGSVVAWGAGYLGDNAESRTARTNAVRVSGPDGSGFLDLGITPTPGGPVLSTGFTPRADVTPSSVQVSNPATVGGMLSFPVGVTVGGGGDFSVGCAGPWATSGTVAPGDVICLRVTASANPGTTASAVIADTFGFSSATFSVTTPYADGMPDRPHFAPATGVATSALAITSGTTVTGLTATVTLTPNAGTETSVGCTGTWTAAGSIVSNGQPLCLRGAAPPSPGQTVRRGATIGGLAFAWPVSSVGTGIRAVPAIRASQSTSLGLRDDGAAFAWGDGRTGQLGDGRHDLAALMPADLLDPLPATTSFAVTPIAIAGPAPLRDLALGPMHAVAAANDGTVWTWGRADHGQLGDFTAYERSVPPYAHAIALPAAAKAVAAGTWHSLALDVNGVVWAWGRNQEGQAGPGCVLPRCVAPTQAIAGGIVAIAAAGTTSYAVGAAGEVYCWGRCYGASSYVLQSTPTLWTAISGVKSIASSAGSHWLAVMLDGTVRAWGLNDFGQIGNGTTLVSPTQQWTPVPVPGLANVLQVATGGFDGRVQDDESFFVFFHNPHSLALKSDGTVWAWGDNAFGQLGDGTQQQRPAPVQVAGLTGASGIAAGWGFSLALKADGRVVGWGRERFGELGDADGFQFTASPPGTPLEVAGPGGTGTLALGVADNTVFAPQTEVPVSSLRVSNTIVGNWAAGSAISVSATGAGPGPEYSIGCGGTFTAAAGTIGAGQSVCVRLTSAASLSTSRTATLAIAGVPRTFTLTTVAGDTTPDVFRFAPVGGQALSVAVDSAPVAITGISGPTTVSVSGGLVAVPCGSAFTSTPSPVSAGQSICARVVSAATPDTRSTVRVTVGTRFADFHAFTAPSASFTATPSVGSVNFSAALRSDGRPFLWGGGNYGAMGSGSFANSPFPAAGTGLTGVTALRSATYHTLAIRSDKTLWAWGRNESGQLGDGTQVDSNVPILVPGLANVRQAVGAASHSVALLEDNSVWAWGENLFGQLGNGTTVSSSTPVPVSITNVKAITTGLSSSLALKNDGTVWCWGFCVSSGGSNVQSTPVQVAPAVLTAIDAIEGSGVNGHVLALKAGTVWAWGTNDKGQVGNGTAGPVDVFPPVQVPGLAGAVQVSAGQYHSLAVLDNAGTRTVWVWGGNDFGQLGLGTSPTDGGAVSVPSPRRLLQADGAVSVKAGIFASWALRSDGNVLAWGLETNGAIGNGVIFNGTRQPVPVAVLGPKGDGLLSLQFFDTTPDPFAFPARFGVDPGATVQSNTVRITGLSAASPVSITGGTYAKNCTGGFTNVPGSINNNETICVQVAAPASFESSASATLTIGSGNGARSATFTVRTRRASGSAPIAPQIALGNAHSLVLAANGTVSGAGYNANGQLGNGTTLNTPTALRVPGFTGARRIAAGAYHSLAVNGDGTVSAWGYNAVGQLGLGAADSVRANPTLVPGLANVVAVAAGDFHSLALLQDGTVRAWGFNAYGQLGNGNTTNQSSPVLVSGLANVIAIAAGGQHSLALLADGTLRAWGANDSGQLGDGTTVSRSLPTPVSGLSTPGTANVVAIAAGTSHSLALRSSGTAWSWGANAQGQLGLGNTTPVSVPTQVAALGTNVGLVAAGGNHSLAVKAGGALFSWGANANGQLGDGLSANRTTPFAVTTPAQATAIAAGARHSAAIDATGKVYLWGDNFFGQVGNRTGNFTPHSANLNVLRGDSRISTGAGGTGGGTTSSNGSGVLSLGNLGGAFSFGTVAVGQSSSTPVSYQNVAATNPIGGLSVSASGTGYSIGGTCPSSLAPSDTCAFSVDFMAGSPGFYPGQLRIDSDLVGAPEVREFEASAVSAQSAALVLVTNTVSFAPTVVGTVSAATPVTVTNTGTAILSVTSVASSSPAYGVTNGCTSVAPGANCTITFTFAPAAVGTSNASVMIVSNGGNAQVALLGTGIAATYDSVPDAFSFPAATGVQPLAVVTSAPAAITGIGGATPVSVQGGEYSIGCTGAFTTTASTVTNGQTVCVRHVAGAFGTNTVTTLTVGGVSATFVSTSVIAQTLTVAKAGTGAGTVTSAPAGINCGTSCSAPFGQGASVTLSALPGSGSVFAGWSGACSGTGTCNVTMDAARSVTATFDFSASAGALTPNPASLDFGGQSMNTTSPALAMTLTNTGGSALTVSSIAASTYFAVTHNCGTVAAGASCTANVTFTPAAEGALFGTLTVTTSAGAQGFSLAGTGERSLVTHYYRAILRRAPDAGGKAFWPGARPSGRARR